MNDNTISTSTDQMPSAITSLYDSIEKFNGYPFQFLLTLIRNPGISYSAAARAVGIKPETAYNYDYNYPGFREAKQAIAAATTGLKADYARLAMLAAVPDVADKMIERATGDGRDAQRAGERILEQVGVLRNGPQTGDLERIDVIAARLFYSKRGAASSGTVIDVA